MNRIASHLLMITAELVGTASLLLFAVFAFAGPVVAVRLDLSERGVLICDAVLSLLS